MSNQSRALAVVIVVTGVALSNAAPIFSDGFESYANTAAMQAVWDAAGVGTLDTTTGNPGQSLAHAGGVANQHSFAGTAATDANPIVWQFDFLDDGIANKRITGSLRDVGGSAAGTQALLEMGRYNSVVDPETATTISGYAVRTFFLGGPTEGFGWISFLGNPAERTGWHRFRATVGSTFVNFDLDFDADGTIDASRFVAITAGAGRLYNLVRFGGPSNLTSASGGGNFDNLSISIVPEPMTVGLAFIACAGVLTLRRRLA